MVKKQTGTSNTLLHELLASPESAKAQPIADFKAWKTIWQIAGGKGQAPMVRSIWGGFLCDRLAWVFFSGYQGAIRQLIPDLPDDTVAAICITESGGNHPRAIQTRLTHDHSGYRLSGQKQFITGAQNADLLLVAASEGITAGRNRIRITRVDRKTAGVTLSPMQPLAFVPEIRHSKAHFDNVHISADRLLAGDGYTSIIKPFRTLEDLHVTGAVLGFLLGIGRRFGWPGALLARILALIELTVRLAQRSPGAPDLHLATEGLLTLLEGLIADSDDAWRQVAPDLRSMWQRDRTVLTIAAKPRKKRFAKAWTCYG